MNNGTIIGVKNDKNASNVRKNFFRVISNKLPYSKRTSLRSWGFIRQINDSDLKVRARQNVQRDE